MDGGCAFSDGPKPRFVIGPLGIDSGRKASVDCRRAWQRVKDYLVKYQQCSHAAGKIERSRAGSARLSRWTHAVPRPDLRHAVHKNLAIELACDMDTPELSDAEFRGKSPALLARSRTAAGQTRNRFLSTALMLFLTAY